MVKAEIRFRDFIIRHRLKLLVIFSTLLSLYARFVLRGILSEDMETCLLPWYHEIRALGGFSSLSTQVGNYNIPYQTLIALMTRLPLKPEYAYKGLSILFDYALAAAVAACVSEVTHSRFKAAVSYAVAVILPVTVLNSAAWGQCDSIFTFFLAVSFYCLLREKHTAALLLFGCSLAFKLQAVFFLPFLLFFCFRNGKIPLWKTLLVLLPPIVLSAGALLQGRPFRDIFEIYYDQTYTFTRVSLNYPSFWNLLVESNVKGISDYYPEMYRFCIALTLIVLMILMVRQIREKMPGKGTLLCEACVMMYTCVLFLPAMHERYAYPVLLFVLMLCFADPRAVPAGLGMMVLDLQTYGAYLFDREPMPWAVLSLINTACYGWLVYLLLHNGRNQDNSVSASVSASE